MWTQWCALKNIEQPYMAEKKYTYNEEETPQQAAVG